MVSFPEAVGTAVKSAFCAYLGANANAESFFNELSPVDLPETGQFWNRALCDRNQALPPTPPPFTGGQCPTTYSIRFERRVRNSQCDDYGPWNLNGPLGAYQGPISSISTVTSESQGGGFLDELRVVAANGTFDIAAVSRPEDCGLVAQVRNIEVIRQDGQPDNCGDPTADPPPFPPEGDVTNVNITYVNNEGDNVTELGDLVIFAPVVIAPVTVIAPIRVDLPDVSFNGNIVLSPDFNIQLQPPSFRRGPGDTDAPPPPENPDTSPTTPQDDSTRRIIGAITTVTSDPSSGLATEVASATGPDLFVPRMGTLSFRVRASGSLSWTTPVDIKTTRQFIPAPENVQALDAIASPNPNYSIAVTLVYGDSRP
jgi:hypothetical protein